MEDRLSFLLETYKDEPVPPNISLEIKQIKLALKTVDNNMDQVLFEPVASTPLYNERNVMPSSGTVPSKVARNSRVLSRVAR